MKIAAKRATYLAIGVLLLFLIANAKPISISEKSMERENVLSSMPPPSGTWSIIDSTIIESDSLIINGSIVVESGGSLLLNRSTVHMNCPSDDAYNITVRDGGSLEVVQSTIRSQTVYAWFMEADTGSDLIIRDGSSLIGAGMGSSNLVTIRCNYASITNSTLDNQHQNNLVYIYEADHAYLAHNTLSNSNGNGIETWESVNATIMYNDFVNISDKGISLTSSSDYSSVIGNHLNSIGSYGVHVLQSNYVNTSCNVLESINNHAIYHNFASYSNVTGNAIHDSDASGILYRGSYDDHLIQGNYVENLAGTGIYIGYESSLSVSQVTMKGNVVENAQDAAIRLQYVQDSDIYMNAFQNETAPHIVIDSNSQTISWDNDTYGNYWPNYNGTDGDSDGIGDQTWNITADKSHQDNYPLMDKSIPWQILSELVYAPPEIVSLTQTPEDVSPVSSVNFRLVGDSDYGINKSLFGWEIGPTSEISSWYEMNRVGNEWNYTVPPQSFGTEVVYAAKCQSRAGEWTETELRSYTVTEDETPPEIDSLDHSPETPTNLDEVTVSASITDGSGIDTAILSYSVDEGDWINVTMEQDGSVYTANIPAQAVGSAVDYKVMANDTFDNWDTSIDYSYVVEAYDGEGPVISLSLDPAEPTSDDDVTVSAEASDPSGVADVTIAYKIGTGGVWTNLTTTEQSGSYVATIPAQAEGDEVFYRAYALDNKGNWNTTQAYSYIVLNPDVHGPSMTWHIEPSEPTAEDEVWVYVSITDSSGVDSAIVSYSRDDGATWYNATMELVSDSNWKGNTGQHPYGVEVTYKIYAWDIYGNVRVSENDTFFVGNGLQTSPTTTTPGDLDTGMLLMVGVAVVAVVIVIVVAMKKLKA